MGQCELCGKITDSLEVARIEGVEMKVCSDCAPLGTKPKVITFKSKPSTPRFLESDEEVIPNVHKVLKKAREERHLTQKELAKILNLKESQLHQFESGSRKPTLETAKKMQKILGVKLIHIVEDEEFEMPQQKESSTPQAFTLGDLIKKK